MVFKIGLLIIFLSLGIPALGEERKDLPNYKKLLPVIGVSPRIASAFVDYSVKGKKGTGKSGKFMAIRLVNGALSYIPYVSDEPLPEEGLDLDFNSDGFLLTLKIPIEVLK